MNAQSKRPIRKVRAVMGAGLSLTGFAGLIVWLASVYGLEIPGEVAVFIAAALVSAGTSAAGYFAQADVADLLVLDNTPPQEGEDNARP